MVDSIVIQFLQTIWHNIGDRSYQRLNNALQAGLRLAINAKFKFESEDFTNISRQFNFHYWGIVGPNGSLGESFYSLACEKKNKSAAIAFENWRDRKPFFYFGKRLAVGSEFNWWESIPEEAQDESKRAAIIERGYKAIKLQVSSFSKCGHYLNAVFYEKPQWRRETGARPDRQFRLERKDLKAVEKALKPEKKKTK